MELFVAADDRTGAFEVAAALADRIGEPVRVTAWPTVPGLGVAVCDLGSRHLAPPDARARVGDLPRSGRAAHKIDSTLRGNWSDEIAEIAVRRPVLLIPALPEFGRTCVGGVVLEHGQPVHHGDAGSDVRRPVTTSRPAEALAASGVDSVTELTAQAGVERWLKSPLGVAVADASDQLDIDRLVASWLNGPPDVVLAGTSIVIGAAAGPAQAGLRTPAVDGPVVVVCGSVHPAARAQLDVAEREGVPIAVIADDFAARQLERQGAVVLATEIPVGDLDEPIAVAAAAGLASGLAALRQKVRLGAVVIIGGDTAAAVLGDSVVMVQGSIAPGTALLTVEGMAEPVITRSGGFGGERALIDVLQATLRT